MKKRRALLIGVPEYQNKSIRDLPVVRRDVASLELVLKRSGFDVRSQGIEDKFASGRSMIWTSLRQACQNAKSGEILLLYFSGHGVHYQGKDYLVPSDAILDQPEAFDQFLVPCDLLDDVVDQSKAETIVFFIDACREGLDLGVKGLSIVKWTDSLQKKAMQRNFLRVFSCSRGQYSRFTKGEQGLSLFTQAIVDVLAPEHPARELGDILRAAQDRLDELVDEHDIKHRQQICYLTEDRIDALLAQDMLSRVILKDTPLVIAKSQTEERWRVEVLQSPLWSDENTDTDGSVAELKQQICRIVTACWQQWSLAHEKFQQDPWRDELYTIRILKALELLVLQSDPPAELTSVEKALVIAAPFVCEAVLANALAQAVEFNLDPLSLDETNPAIGFQIALGKVHRLHQRLVTKAQQFTKQGCVTECDAVKSWLLYRCLLRTPEIWQFQLAGGYLSVNFANALEEATRSKFGLGTKTLSPPIPLEILTDLGRSLLAEPESIDRYAAKQPVGFLKAQVIRVKMLGYLLKLAGLLAIDVRTLSDVLVDNIGLADRLTDEANRLTPEEVCTKISESLWLRSGAGYTLSVTCRHPALDFALREHVEYASTVLNHVLRNRDEKPHGLEALSGLPLRLTTDGIKPERGKNKSPLYKTPHVYFQLAHDEIRDLLMGEQLYGDPALAIRELYQNALDACRYREARHKYLKQKSLDEYLDHSWEGHIIFTQGIDDNGRSYIECKDNGIGMGSQQLTQCFARAGRRFSDLPEFIKEQAEWLQCYPPIRLYPNSQFGIGVFSYFMLAEELLVETCQLESDGRPGKRLRVHVPGSSGLFRIQESGLGTDSGTRVRLYLNKTHLKGKGQLISCIEILRKLLWVAEFRTEVQQFGRLEVWEPGQLRHPDYPQSSCLKAANTDIWWVPEKSEYWYRNSGCILSDGLWTEESQPGFVANLCGKRRPKLTVDRKNIVQWARNWVSEALKQNAEPLLNWPHLNLEWLWKLAQKHPQVAEYVVEMLSQRKAKVKLGIWGYTDEVPISELGCFEPDRNLHLFRHGLGLEFRFLAYYFPWWILPYRVIAWERCGLVKVSTTFLESLPASMKLELCPVPRAGDGIALSEDLHGSLIHSLQDNVPPAHIVLSAERLNEPIVSTVKRLQRFVPLGLKMPKVDLESLNEKSADEEDLIALSRRIAEKDKYPWLEKRISAAHIVLTSARLGESVPDIIRRLRKFAPLGLGVTQVNLETLDKVPVSQEDIIALSKELDGEEALSSDQISPAQIIFAANRLNESIAETLRRLEKFIPIGLELPKVDLKTLGNFQPIQNDLLSLSKKFDGKSAWTEDRMPVAHIVRLAGQLNEPVADTLQRLQRFLPLGLKLPYIDLHLIDNFTIDREDVIIFSEELGSDYSKLKSTWLEDQVAPAHLITAAVKLNKTVVNSLERFKRFVPLGLKVPEMHLQSLEALISDKKNLIALSKNLSEKPDQPNDILQGTIHPTRIILAALVLEESVTKTLERFRRFASVLGLTLPEGEPEFWRFCTDESEESASGEQ